MCQSGGQRRESTLVLLDRGARFETNASPVCQERKRFFRILLEGFLVTQLVRCNDELEFFPLEKCALEEPVDPFPISPISGGRATELRGNSAKFEHELGEER